MSTPLAVVLVPMHATPDDQPPPLTALRLLTEWSLDWWLVVGLAIPAVLYAAGLVRLRRRGDRWPVRRSVAFFGGGLGTAAIATLSGLGAYDTVLFSVHVVQHMILMMVTPMFMALGAPVTLALRTLPRRPRTRLLSVLHSRPARVLTFAPLALALFIATPFALYFSSFYELSLRSAFWHAFLHIHFVIIGSLLMWPLTGIDPIPGRMSYPMRLLVMFLMLPFHAFLGISIMSSTQLIAEDWYLAFNRTWPPSPLDDQYLAGAIMWGSGDITAVFVLAALFVQWFAHSQREARRVDRRLDRLDERARAKLTPADPSNVSSEGGRPPSNPPKSVNVSSEGGRPPSNPPKSVNVSSEGGRPPSNPPKSVNVSSEGGRPPSNPPKSVNVSSEGGRPPSNPPRSMMGANISPSANQEMNSE